jgi:hypothetical protein
VSKTIDMDRYPSKLVIESGSSPNQWKELDPIRREHDRIFPVLPEGLHLTSYNAHGVAGAAGPGTPRDYRGTIMVKVFVYNPLRKIVEPEGETGCWIYFNVNSVTAFLPGRVDKIMYDGNSDDYLFACNLKTEKDASGNKILYTSAYGKDYTPEGWYFSYNQELPVRQISRKELFTAFYIYTTRNREERIKKYETKIEKDQRYYDTLSAEGKKQETYWPELLARERKDLATIRDENARMKTWYDQQMKRTDLDQPAVVENLFDNIAVEKLDTKTGYNVWRNNPAFYDSAKPKDKPQFIFLKIRPQLGSVPKENYITQFREKFNLDVLARMVGDRSSQQQGRLNTIEIGNEEKTETKTAKSSPFLMKMNFEKDMPGSPPAQWRGMQNNLVVDYLDSKWLGLSKPGYCYPRQFNKNISNGFELSFQLEWNKEISYYTGEFLVSFASLPYDNALQAFRVNDATMNLNSFYDGYVAGFDHLMLRFDPHFNNGGSLQVIGRDKLNTRLLDKRILLPDFFKEKNSHQLNISRNGNSLLVTDNGKLIADIPNAFAPEVNYNAYVFSKYKSNNGEPTDTYYLNNVEVKY